jgi:hypothetical protein
VPVEGSTQYRCWRPAAPRRQESRGDRGQRVSGAGPGCRQGPFHGSVGRRVFQPADGGSFGHGPRSRFPGSGAEVQAFAGSADEFRPVTVRQPPGDERPRPGPAGGMPADLERPAAVRPAADRMDTDIKRVHGSQHPPPPPCASAHVTGTSGPRLARRAGPGSGGHQEGQRNYRRGCAGAQETSRGTKLPTSGIRASAATEGERNPARPYRPSAASGCPCRPVSRLIWSGMMGTELVCWCDRECMGACKRLRV